MRIARYSIGKTPKIAIAVDGGPFRDLSRSWQAQTGDVLDLESGSTLGFILEGPELWGEARELVGVISDPSFDVDPSARGFRWLCPMDGAASLRDFLAFEDHVKRGAERRGTEVSPYWYEAPIYYKGSHRELFGPDEDCPWPSYTQHLDFELELAMILGDGGRDITPEQAPDFIFGFTVFNDFSARDVQAKEMSAWLGPAKGKDFANALGPCIVTVDEVGPEPDLEMICRVNGEEWGRARSSDMHWKWADMIAHVSQDEDVWPTDIYGSGTPGGCCGLDLERKLEPNDVVELEIEKIGVLRNRVTPPAR